MAGVWISELQPYGRGLDEIGSIYDAIKFWNSKGVPKLTPFWCFARRGKPPSRRRPRRRAVAVLAAKNLTASMPRTCQKVLFLHRRLPSASLWIGEWLQGSLQNLCLLAWVLCGGWGCPRSLAELMPVGMSSLSENFCHLAWVWISVACACWHDLHMTLLCSKVLKFQRCSETDSVLVLHTQGESRRAAAGLSPSSPPGRRRPRRGWRRRCRAGGSRACGRCGGVFPAHPGTGPGLPAAAVTGPTAILCRFNAVYRFYALYTVDRPVMQILYRFYALYREFMQILCTL